MVETKIKTPNGKYSDWTSLGGGALRFNAQEYPGFRTYIETDGTFCQSTELYNIGIGDRKFVAADGPAFIGNSWGKSYHCLMWNHTVLSGDKTKWQGKYSWYRFVE